MSHTRAQMFRAVLEGVGFGVRHNLETFASIGAKVKRVVAVGGGTQSDSWLQVISDISGTPQELPEVTVGAAYGDAFLAGRAAGLLDATDIHRWVKPQRVITPNAQHKAFYDAMYGQYLKLYEGTRDVVHALKALTSASR